MEQRRMSRRRLSAYRPHNWRYPIQVLPVHNERLSLEQLPVVILAAIFDLLKVGDLLNVCVASKYFYLPAVMRLYQRIVITNNYLRTYADKYLSRWLYNIGTSVPPGNVVKLADVVTRNDKLALLMHTLIVTEKCDIMLLREILTLASIIDLYYVGDGPLPQRLLHNVISLTTLIQEPFIAPLLTELHICKAGDDPHSDKYRRLALSMIDNDTFQNLRTLAFENTDDRNLNTLNQLNDDNERPLAGWILFFEVFAQRQTLLQVTNLILEGFVSSSGAQIAHLISQTVNMDNLNSLALLCTELSHAHALHYDNDTTLLENITKHTKYLRELSISPTDDCLTCQVNAIINTLKVNLHGQLRNLLVVFESPNASTSANVKLAILHNQSKLELLRYRDKTTQGGLKSEIYSLLSLRTSELEHGTFYNYRIRKGFFPNSFTYMGDIPFLSDPLVTLIETMGPQIADVLNKDDLLSHVSMMPSLEFYELMDFPLCVKRQGFLVNGEVIPYGGRV